jgi:hypothetical protein
MPFLIQYLIKLSISLGVVWLFYQLVLRRLTFYNWNRLFLLGYSGLAFFIPFIDISPVLERNELTANKLVQFIPVVETLAAANKDFSMNVWDWTITIFTTGCFVLLIRLIIQHLSFLRLRRSAELILETPVKLYQINKEIIPFSFAGSIFINRQQHTEEDLNKIIRHEFIHLKQKHSIDMLWAEWLCTLNWYNPFAWLIRNAIRQNLEFIADSKVVQNGIDKKQYQYLLLKVMGAPQYSIATNFNFTSLKKRIAMMNKMRTARVHLMKFIFVLPLIAVLLVSFRNKIYRQVKKNVITRESLVQDTIPVRPALPAKPVPPPPPAEPPVPAVAPEAPELPANVASIHIKNKKLTLVKKNGQTEIYDLDKPEQKASFEKKYGTTPVSPQPPHSATNPDHRRSAPVIIVDTKEGNKSSLSPDK